MDKPEACAEKGWFILKHSLTEVIPSVIEFDIKDLRVAKRRVVELGNADHNSYYYVGKSTLFYANLVPEAAPKAAINALPEPEAKPIDPSEPEFL